MKLPRKCCCCSTRAGAITLGSVEIGLAFITAIVVSGIVMENLEKEGLSMSSFVLFLIIDIGLFILPGILLIFGAAFCYNWLILPWLFASISHTVLLLVAIVLFPKDVIVPMAKLANWEGVDQSHFYEEYDFRHDIVQVFGKGTTAFCSFIEIIFFGLLALQVYSSLTMYSFYRELKDY